MKNAIELVSYVEKKGHLRLPCLLKVGINFFFLLITFYLNVNKNLIFFLVFF